MFSETDALSPKELEQLDSNCGITAEELEDAADGI